MDKISPQKRIEIANIIYKVKGDVNAAFEWIKGIKPETLVENSKLGNDGSLNGFHSFIKINKLLNLSGNELSILDVVSDVKKGSDEEILIEFERMLCLITQIFSDGLQKKITTSNITTRIYPIVHFYYREFSLRDKYSYKLKQSKEEYFGFLIIAVSELGEKEIKSLGDYLLKEFIDFPEFWHSRTRRVVIKSLFIHGYDIKSLKDSTLEIESFMFDGKDIDGRITECREQSNLWLILNESKKAEGFLNQCFKESLGVGYSKDYQFNIWIEWLRKINNIEPEHTSDRIKRFLSHIGHIKDTTEGLAYSNASSKLLDTTFKWNFGAGFNQLKWQLKEGLCSFEDSMSAFIESFLDRAKIEKEFSGVLRLFLEVYLHISDSGIEYLLNRILKRGYSLLGENFFKDYLPIIIETVNIVSIEEDVISIHQAIGEFATMEGVDIKDYCPKFEMSKINDGEESQEVSNTLIVDKDYKRLSEKEVLEKVNSCEDLKALLERVSHANTYFNWNNVLNKISQYFSITDINEIVSNYNVGMRHYEFFAKLSEIALSLEDRELALKLGKKSLELSNSSGWIKHYDGGSRIIAFNALSEIDSSVSNNLAFEVFSNDVLSSGYPSEYIKALDDILPLLTDSIRIERLWTEIFGYVERLMTNSTPIKDLPELEEVDKSISDILIDYLIYLSNNQVSSIKEKARKLLAYSINDGSEYAIQCLNSINDSNIDGVEIVNEVLMLLLEMKSDKVSQFKQKAFELSISKDYSLRLGAYKILLFLEEKIPVPHPIERSALYDIVLKTNVFNGKVFEDGDEELIIPYEYFINVLSEETGIRYENLTYRIVSIMRDIDDPNNWTDEGENKLRFYLEEIELKYPYQKLRVKSVKRAIMRLITELIDSNCMDDSRINRIFTWSDYAVPFFKEIPKPYFVQRVCDLDTRYINKKWLDISEDTQRLKEGIVKYEDSFNIIAEYSLVRNLGWEKASETYMHQLAFTSEIIKNEVYIFDSIFHGLFEDYHIHEDIKLYNMVILNHRFEHSNLKSNWIAFNPDLARYLGWVPNTNELFAWNDSEGILMVKSIYWSSGNIDISSRKDSEVGEGWFVVISDYGLEQLKSLRNNLFIQKTLKRSMYEEKIIQQNSKSKVISYK